MSISRSGIKNLAYLEDEDHQIDLFNKTKDSISNRTESNLSSETCENESNLYKGEKLSAKGIILMVSLAAPVFTGCLSYSLVAPFLPRTAEQKGLSISQYSLIFVIYEIIGFCLPPFASKVAIRITPKVFLITSLIIISFSSTVFGFLVYSKNGNEFLILCLIVRIFWAVGGASSTTAAYMCGTLLYPNHVSQVYAVIEIGSGLGFMCGPLIGGYLFEYGGFTLPFIVASIFCLISIIPIYFLIQNEVKPKDKDDNGKATTFLSCLRTPGVSINLLISAVTCFAIGFNESTLDHHLREIGNLSPSQVGRVFLISGLLYSIFAFIFGSIAKKMENSYNLIFLGLVLLICSFIVVGPIYGLPLKPMVINVIISQICFGIGMGALFVLSFDDCVKEAKKHLPKNDSTMAAISGLYTSSYAAGTAIGPLVGGQLVEAYGYRKATISVTLTMIFLLIIVIIYVTKIKKTTNLQAK